jgi:hypothetical protein
MVQGVEAIFSSGFAFCLDAFAEVPGALKVGACAMMR